MKFKETMPTLIENSLAVDYKYLKDALIKGSMSFKQVRDKLLEFDQSDLSRKAADKNLEFLLDPIIIDFVNKNTKILEGYYRFLSLTEFHVAQRIASNDIQEAKKHFNNALNSAKRGFSTKSWKAYIEGTLLYIQSKKIPDSIIEQVEEEKNVKILQNFNKGLAERGFPEYNKDYWR
mgnify:CR=1 FL=1